MPAIAIPALISAGGVIGSSIISNRASNKASQNQLTASREANAVQDKSEERAIEFQREQMDYDRWLEQARGLTRQPYLDRAASEIGGGDAGYQPERYEAAAPFHAPTMDEAASDPGYQLSLRDSKRAIEGNASSRGTLLTTGLSEDLSRDAASRGAAQYDKVYGRAQDAYSLSEGLRGAAFDRNAQGSYQAASLAQAGRSSRISELLQLAGLASPGAYPGYKPLNDGEMKPQPVLGSREYLPSDDQSVGVRRNVQPWEQQSLADSRRRLSYA